MSGGATRLTTLRTERGRNPSFFLSGAFADLLELKRAEFSRKPAFAIFLLDLMAFVQYDENPKNIILGLDRIDFMVYNDGTNKEEVTPMKEHLIRFLDNRLELARATTATRSLVRTYETQAFGALTFYCDTCYYENKAQEEEALTNLWNVYYHTEFFNAWLEKTK